MNSPTFTLKLSSSPLSIIAFHTRLEVNHDWTATIHVLSDMRLPNLLQQSAVIVAELNGAVNQLLNGVVVGMDNGWQTGDGLHYELTLRSLLVYLEIGKHNRVFVQDSVSDILPSVFKGTHIMASDYQLNTKQTLKPHPQLVQYKETDLDFFHRLLSYEGLQYTAGISTPAVQLYDNLQQLPTDATLILPYCDPKSTPVGDAVFTLSPRHFNLPILVSYRSHNFQDPTNSLEVTATSKSKIGGRGKIVKADVGYLTEAEGQALVDRHMATLDAQREVFTLNSNCLDVTLGQVLQITGEPYITDLKNKFLRTVAIEHYYHDEHRVPERIKLSNIYTQLSGYHNRIIAIDAEHRYYSMTEVPVQYHGLLQAKVESTGGNNDQLDALGRYTVKFAFDTNTHAKGAASTPMPAAQLSAGPNSGLHSPFVPGADVVVQCIKGDLRQCVILGTLPTEDSPSTVSSSNAAQSLWQTPNGQSLLLDDSEYARTLRIATAHQQNTLEMSDSGTTVSTLQGDININAGHDYHEHVKQNLTATIGNNHTQQVQGNHSISTNEGSITQLSGRDFNQLSQTSITQTAEQNSESNACNDMTTFAKNNILMQAQGGAFTLQTAKDAINIHGANSIRIISQKGISIAQAGGLIQFDDQGNLTIQGNQIDLNYQNIDFSGNQTTSTASGQAAQAPTVPVITPLNAKKTKLHINTIGLLAKQAKVVVAKTNISLPNSGSTKHPLTYEQTGEIAQLHLDKAIIDLPQIISDWELSQNDEYRLYLKQQKIQQKIDFEPEQQVVMLEASGQYASPLQMGNYQLDALSPDEINWLHKMINGLIIGAMVFNSDIGQFITSQQQRAFLLDFIHGGSFYVKEIKGVPYVIFRGSRKLRQTIRGTRYRYDNPALKAIKIQALMQSSQKLRGLAEGIKGGGIGLFLVTALDLSDYFSNPDNKEDIIDLMTKILVDISEGILAIVIATLAVAALPIDAVALVIGAGIAIGFGAGWLLDKVEQGAHLTEHTQEQVHNSIDYIRNELFSANKWLNNHE